MILSLNSVNRLIVVMMKCGVFFAVRAALLNITWTSFSFKGGISSSLPVHRELIFFPHTLIHTHTHTHTHIYIYIYIYIYIRTYIRTYISINPCSRDLLVKTTFAQQFNKFFGFYGTRRFIDVFKRARHWAHPEADYSKPYCQNLFL
jgi:hypothetical protein